VAVFSNGKLLIDKLDAKVTRYCALMLTMLFLLRKGALSAGTEWHYLEGIVNILYLNNVNKMY